VNLAGLILAGGASRRMGTPKALLELESETFLDRLVRIFRSCCDEVVVVLGHDAARIRDGSRLAATAIQVENPAPERGQLSSLHCGLAALETRAAGVMFTPVDYAGIRRETAAELAGVFTLERPPLVLPCYRGRRGHPVCVGVDLVGELMSLPADGQARDVIRRHLASARLLDVEDPGILLDVDEPEDYRRLLAARS